MNRRVEIRVTGIVQGVFFRQGVKAEAMRRGLIGWVRNEPDGSVRIVAEGEEEKLREFIDWCKKGTEWARIEKVETEWGEAKEEFDEFEIV